MELFTSEEMHAIKAAIDLALQHKEELALDVELVETARRKMDEVVNDQRDKYLPSENYILENMSLYN